MSSHNDALTTAPSADHLQARGAADLGGSTCQADLSELQMLFLLQISSRPADMHQVGQHKIWHPDDAIRIEPETHDQIP